MLLLGLDAAEKSLKIQRYEEITANTQSCDSVRLVAFITRDDFIFPGLTLQIQSTGNNVLVIAATGAGKACAGVKKPEANASSAATDSYTPGPGTREAQVAALGIPPPYVAPPLVGNTAPLSTSTVQPVAAASESNLGGGRQQQGSAYSPKGRTTGHGQEPTELPFEQLQGPGLDIKA